MKTMIRLGLLLALLVSPSFAQPNAPTSVREVAFELNNVINSWAQTIEAQKQQISALQARVKALEDKYEPKVGQQEQPK